MGYLMGWGITPSTHVVFWDVFDVAYLCVGVYMWFSTIVDIPSEYIWEKNKKLYFNDFELL